ncbi:MAG: Rpn family recombination-promoting nuclease/putative transposase [Lachnospiraceae bacterium]|nr:Rpn family recombination-promoting nuclease/putative transposase [Lachnospiraceae bacterium]
MKNKKSHAGTGNARREKAPVRQKKPDRGHGKSSSNRGSIENTGIKNEVNIDNNSAPNSKDNTHNRDINSKTIFRNPVLCAQFLRDNCDIPALKHVRPEDIEDISERYLPYLGTEFDSDSVKKIRIFDITGRAVENAEGEGENAPPFLVSLIDHKSLVDYDAPMQLLRYMMCIWTEYRREMERKQEGCTSRKSFRYPVILPIIYYEGKAAWTADRHFSGRIGNREGYGRWIPDFQYEVVRIHDYSDEELLKRGDEMSLIMMINKIQDASDLDGFLRMPGWELDKIVQDSPMHVIDVMAKVVESLCFKIDASEEERTECVRKVRKRRMGYLFENMEHMSLQEERRKTEEQRRKTEEQCRKTEEQRRRAEAESRRAEAESQRADKAEEKLRQAEEIIRQLREKNPDSQ